MSADDRLLKQVVVGHNVWMVVNDKYRLMVVREVIRGNLETLGWNFRSESVTWKNSANPSLRKMQRTPWMRRHTERFLHEQHKSPTKIGR